MDQLTVPSIECLTRPGQPGAGRGRSPDRKPDLECAHDAPAAIVCRGCGHLITDRRHRISVQGRHDHRFMNPGGFLYHVGCFAEAIGCVVVGPDSPEYPWFAGHLWRCAHCGGCGQQLGWQFRAGTGGGEASRFFGLILDRLHEAPPSPA